jgi:sRNA-binding regulator protein Hfq
MRYQRPVPRNYRPDSDPEEPGTGPNEADYLRRLAEEHTPVVVHLRTGESFQGFVEYYDKRFIRLTRQNAPNVFIFKQDIKYLHEQ